MSDATPSQFPYVPLEDRVTSHLAVLPIHHTSPFLSTNLGLPITQIKSDLMLTAKPHKSYVQTFCLNKKKGEKEITKLRDKKHNGFQPW